MSAKTQLTPSSAASLLAAALVVMPFLQALPLHFDRGGAMVLLLPGIWAGRMELAQAVGRIKERPLRSARPGLDAELRELHPASP